MKFSITNEKMCIKNDEIGRTKQLWHFDPNYDQGSDQEIHVTYTYANCNRNDPFLF